ncbi:MAG: hypothetical protein HZA90_25110 [Verrucomicrobia bacterium]|nr:hypothetical protein [Verrucomicrobiota bacterium]
MPVIHVEAEVSREQLLEAVRAMPRPELDAFLKEILSLRSERKGGQRALEETALLERIHAGPSQEQWARFHELSERRRREVITEPERSELFRLVDVVEEYQASRAEALVALARLRGVPMRTLMASLGIESPGYV